MRDIKRLFLGLLGSCLLAGAAHAQGLLGEPSINFGGGFVRLSVPDESINGVGAAASMNTPLVTDRLLGLDFDLGVSYRRLRGSELSIDGYGATGLFRGYAPFGTFIAPYAEVGLGWSSDKIIVPDDSATLSGLTLPVGAGVQFRVGSFSLTPFYTYVVGLDNDVTDLWTVGGRVAYWLTREWGMILTVTHTDFRDDSEQISAIAGFIFSY